MLRTYDVDVRPYAAMAVSSMLYVNHVGYPVYLDDYRRVYLPVSFNDTMYGVSDFTYEFGVDFTADGPFVYITGIYEYSLTDTFRRGAKIDALWYRTMAKAQSEILSYVQNYAVNIGFTGLQDFVRASDNAGALLWGYHRIMTLIGVLGVGMLRYDSKNRFVYVPMAVSYKNQGSATYIYQFTVDYPDSGVSFALHAIYAYTSGTTRYGPNCGTIVPPDEYSGLGEYIDALLLYVAEYARIIGLSASEITDEGTKLR